MNLPDSRAATDDVPDGGPDGARTPAAARATAFDRRVPGWLRVGVRAGNQYVGVLAVLVLLIVVLSVSQPQFLTLTNFLNIGDSYAVMLIVATGMTFVLLVGGIDLSVGGMMAITAISLWMLLRAGVPVPWAILAAVLEAFVLGCVANGLLIGKAGLSFLVVTIGSASLLRGFAQIATGGQTQSVYGYKALVKIGSSAPGGVPVTAIIAIAVFILAVLLLRYTGFGRMVYAVGGNPEAARLAGINVAAVRVAVYTISGGLAGLAAVVDTARLTSADPASGTGMELAAGAAVLLGGTSFMGGRGSLLGTLLGVLFLGVLENGTTLAGVSTFWTNVTSGAVLIIAIALDRIRNGPTGP